MHRRMLSCPAPPPPHPCPLPPPAACPPRPPQYEEWEDPSGGLLSDIFDACENDDVDALKLLLEKLKGTEWGISPRGPDGDTPL
jgi:hypothetical protein